MFFRILYQDARLVAIDKPSGYHVHPPENPQIRIPSGRNCMLLLKRQLNQYVYPVHRLDAATSGVLLFALDPEMAREMGALFEKREVKKTYYCVTRGWMAPEKKIDRPLSAEHDRAVKMPAETFFECLAKVELPFAVGKYQSARYSLARAEPVTGRLHQIRRHLSGDAHPIVGDTVHGDGDHNRFFRSHFGLNDLLLKAQEFSFTHPETKELVRIESRWGGKWHKVFDLFGICPIVQNLRPIFEKGT